MQVSFTPAEYVYRLYKDGKGQKARAALEYCFFAEQGVVKGVRDWAKSWGVSKSTAWKWGQEFKEESDRHYRTMMTRQVRF